MIVCSTSPMSTAVGAPARHPNLHASKEEDLMGKCASCCAMICVSIMLPNILMNTTCWHFAIDLLSSGFSGETNLNDVQEECIHCACQWTVEDERHSAERTSSLLAE